MKILFLINSLSGGGAEKLISDLLLLISQTDHCEVLILTKDNDKYSNNLIKNGINVTVIPTKNFIKRIIFIKKYIELNDFDIVHANLFPIIYYCAFVKKILHSSSVKFVMTEHNTYNRRRRFKLFKIIEKYIYNCYDSVVSISTETQNALLDWIGSANKNNFCIIYNGIPIAKFSEASAYERSLIFPEIQDRDILLCMIGSFTEQKNHVGMLKIMKCLPQKYKLIMVGEGPLKKGIEELVYNYNLKESIKFLGFRKDVSSILKTIDLLVIPSKWEGFGLIAVEGMACGKQIVTYDIPGVSEIVGDVGYKVHSKHPEKFAEAIIEASSYVNDINIKNKCIKQALKYDISETAKGYLKLYQDLQASKKGISHKTKIIL